MAATISAVAVVGKSLGLLLTRMLQFAMIAVVFIPLERLIPFHARQRLFRPRLALDLLHYFVGGLFIIVFVRLTYAVMPLLGNRIGIHASTTLTVSHLPGWQQFLIFELSWTLLGYWLHRLEHVWTPLWRMHSIHESTTEIDWLSAFRLHPFEPALFQILTIVPLWYFGVHGPVAMAYTIYAYVSAHVQHANIVFPIGPLKYVFPSPDFHRWHHARVRNAAGAEQTNLVNFGQYPFWDILFGTFYLPSERPVEYGSAYGDTIPSSYLAQLVYPFGWHERVVVWQKRFWNRCVPPAQAERIRSTVQPMHDAVEQQLARLCLVNPTPILTQETIR